MHDVGIDCHSALQKSLKCNMIIILNGNTNMVGGGGDYD